MTDLFRCRVEVLIGDDAEALERQGEVLAELVRRTA